MSKVLDNVLSGSGLKASSPKVADPIVLAEVEADLKALALTQESKVDVEKAVGEWPESAKPTFVLTLSPLAKELRLDSERTLKAAVEEINGGVVRVQITW